MQEVSRWQLFKNKLKNIKRKGLIRIVTFFLIVVIIFLSTFTKWILDPSQLVWNEWLGDTILILGLGICGMVLGESSGLDNQKSLTNGRYQNKLKEYLDIKNKIVGETFYFSQWLVLKRNRDLLEKQRDYLSSFGIPYPEKILENLDISEVQVLKTRPIVKDNFIYKTITEEQFEALKWVYEGNIKIVNDNTNYFFETNSKKTHKSSIEMGEVFRKQDLKINVIFKVSKIVMTIIISMVWATFTISEAGGGGSEVAVNLFSRLISLFGGLLGGISSAVARVINLSDELENKINVLNEFIFDLENPNKSGFKPKEYEEVAKEELEKELELERKAIESVIDNSEPLRIEEGSENE